MILHSQDLLSVRWLKQNSHTFLKEIMATELTLKKSYFDEYEEMVSNESSSEEAD